MRKTFLHDGWAFAEKSWQDGQKLACSTLEWLPATVPGHVHADLVANGVIADPFTAMNELGCQWVDEAEFGYRTRFVWQPDPKLPRRILRFDGLDGVCTVSLNGKRIAQHDDMFMPLEIDVSDELCAGDNELRVDFESATRVGRERRASYFARENLADDIERFDERAFVRKAQYMYGWDWGPRLVSAGIWQPVSLLELAARIVDVHVVQRHEPDGAVTLRATSTVEGEGVVVHVLDGRSVVLDGEELRLTSPELWFPSGLGAQRLYELETFLCEPGFDARALPSDPDRARAALETAVRDRQRRRIGLRQIRLVREPDRFGQSFEFEVNGQRLWAFGANWIPDHSFPGLVRRERLEQKLRAARDRGMNMLRVWGGGLYESDDFYDLCDELGILVWQDFPFACSYYPDTHEWPEIVAREARANVRRLRNHPSLALWCGNNENLTMRQSGWGGKHKHPPRYYGENLYEGVLPKVLAELDPERPYIPTSPWGGEDANQGGIGDQHYWDVWHGRGDWRHYRDSSARFSSEYGFAASCSHKAWRAVFGPDARLDAVDVRDRVVRWHDKTAKGYDTFLGFVALHYPEPRQLEDWIYYSQLNQRDAIRCAVEHYRRSEFCKGSLIWQLNDCWPVQSWALMDSLGQPKAAWFELGRLYAPAIVAIVHEADAVEVWAALDNSPGQTLSGTVTLRAHSLLDGRVVELGSADVRLASGERKAVLRATLPAGTSPQTLLVARLGELSSHALLAEPKDLTLSPPAALDVVLRDGSVEISTPTPLVDLYLWDDDGTAAFAENAVTVAEPGVLRLGYRGSARGLRARSLAGEHELRISK